MRLSDEDLGLELRAMRPLPAPAFAARMDRKVAEGFPRQGRIAFRVREPRRLFAPVAAAVTLVVVAGVAIIESDYGGSPSQQPAPMGAAETATPQAAGGGGGVVSGGAAEGQLLKEQELDATSQIAPFVPGRPGAVAPNQGNRVVESNAQLTLATDADNVPEVADGVIRATHSAGGIVLSSSVTQGSDGATATFQLAIPSAHLQSALSDLSGLAHVQSDSEGSIDITAQVSHARSRVAEANARLASLRAQLAHANAIGDFTTAQQLIRKIRETSFQLDRDKAELRQLERRAKYATVDVTVVSDSSGGDGWTFSDAVHDAGDVLRYAAGITVVSAAVLLPVALLAALVSLVWHARVRRSREAALGDSPE
jgi:Domain of unknown function (DUF4349)